MIKANLADGRVLQFPDGTDPQVIQSTVKRMLGQETQAQPTPEKIVHENLVTPEMGLTRTGQEQYTEVTPVDPEKEGSALSYVTEPAKMIGTAIVTDPISGLAGLRTLLAKGDIEAARKAIEDAQRLWANKPKTVKGQKGLETLGKVISPIAEPISKLTEEIGEVSYEGGGPVAGTAMVTALSAIPEILGMKGTKALKKAKLAKKLAPVADEIFDETGRILPEIERGISDAGIALDEIKDILPDAPKIMETAKQTAQEIGEAAVSGKEGKALRIAEDIKPDIDIINAAKELGITELLPSHVSQNPVYTALEQGLKSIPGSQLAAAEKNVVSQLAEKADNFIKEFGGDIDKSMVSDRFKSEAMGIVEGLEGQADKLYSELRKNLPSDFSVKASNTTKRILDRAKELGGEKFLDPIEKKIYSQLKPSSKPTYARLDNIRKEIGRALNKNSGAFKDANESALKQIYKGLAEDQLKFADRMGWGETYKAANSLIVQRKGIEDKLMKVLGKGLTDTVTQKAKQAVLGLQRGETKAFDELATNIPKELNKETRRSVFASAMNDAFTQGSRKERSLNISGFDDFMTGIKRNKAALTRLETEIGKDAVKRLDTLHKVVAGVRKAQAEAITTGKITAVPKLFDEIDNIASKVYGISQKMPVAGRVSAGAKGAVTGTVEGLLNLKKTARSVAADEFLSSNGFQKIMKDKAIGKIDTAQKIERANKVIRNMKEFKKLKSTMSKKELSELAAVGIIGYLTEKTVNTESGEE